MKYKMMLHRYHPISGKVVRQTIRLKDEDDVLRQITYLTHPIRRERLIKLTIAPNKDEHD
jgi:hypothetical protein